jgi:hypothetical protein
MMVYFVGKTATISGEHVQPSNDNGCS